MTDEHERVRAMDFKPGTVYGFSVPQVTARMVVASVRQSMLIEASETRITGTASGVLLREIEGYAIIPTIPTNDPPVWFEYQQVAGYGFTPEALLLKADWVGLSPNSVNTTFRQADWESGSHMVLVLGRGRFARCLYIQTKKNVGGRQIKFAPLPITFT